MIPILIRTKDRPFYLNTTLKSLTASNIDDSLIIIADDCSETQLMNDYLFTDNEIEFPEFNWYDEIDKEVTTKGSVVKETLNLTDKEIWNRYFGNVPIQLNAKGLKNRFNIIQPETNKGVVGGLFWTIYAGFTMFRNADKIIILEDDLIFHKNWLSNALKIYERNKHSKLGCVSVYNRENPDYSKNSSNFYYEIDKIGGVMYLIPRKIFNIMNANHLFNDDYSNKAVGGDVKFQSWLISNGYKILNTTESYIQHIGVKSLARPGRFLRYSKNFVQPYTWNKNF